MRSTEAQQNYAHTIRTDFHALLKLQSYHSAMFSTVYLTYNLDLFAHLDFLTEKKAEGLVRNMNITCVFYLGQEIWQL